MTYYGEDGKVFKVNTEASNELKQEYYIMSVSKNILMIQGAYSTSVYINENYLKNIPNFMPSGKAD